MNARLLEREGFGHCATAMARPNREQLPDQELDGFHGGACGRVDVIEEQQVAAAGAGHAAPGAPRQR